MNVRFLLAALTLGLGLVTFADFPGSLHTVDYDSPPISYSDA